MPPTAAKAASVTQGVNHETLDSGRPRIHDIATLYQQLDELEQR